MLRIATNRNGLLVALACAALVAAGCGGNTSSGSVCGDAIIEGDEVCDDGNTVDGDGCSSSCTVEGTQCGNNIIETGEECDDGNTSAGDGCDALCNLEVAPGCGNDVVEIGEGCDDGNTDDCDGCSSTCSLELCGNGVTECDEECDDGNSTPGDGCDTDCTLEVSSCGDGTIDTGEECDDGNTANGDGCDSDCQLEVMPGCGNGVVETGEECDDGNTDDCDGCSSGCDEELCGNGVTECAEECDDGNTTAGDGCDATCQSEVVPTCGNATLETGEDCDDGNTDNTDACLNNCTDAGCGDNYIWVGTEECDDGNTTAGDGCDATCQLEIAPGCGNGVVEASEGCDDGNTTACDGCSATCTIEVCGNSTVECTEQCDDGNTTPGDGCDATCQIEVTPVCGNATVETGEDCDDGNSDNTDACLNNCTDAGCGDSYIWTGTEACDDGGNTPGDGCDANCQLEGCGNGTVDFGEGCDDGNSTNTDACPDGVGGTCQPAVCGDGFVQASVEECDDGGTVNGDGCDANCNVETPECLVGWTLTCADSDDWNNGSAGSTDVIDVHGCNSWDESGPEYTYDFVAAVSEDVTVGLSAMTVDLDIFVIDDQGGVCDSANCLEVGETSVTFAAVAGTTYYLVVDGYAGAVGDYTITMVCPSTPGCGDSIVQSSEGCDDGNFDDTDACVTGCVNASCGDAFVQAGVEDCDDGNSNNTDACRNDCTLPVCGDAIVDTGEECDDGNTDDFDGCSSTCTAETCEQDQWPLACGGGETYNNSWGVSPTNEISTYSCVGWDESGPEYTYLYTATLSGYVVVDLTVNTAGEDLDVFVIAQSNGQCSPTNCTAAGDDQVVFYANAGEVYYIIVDGFEGSVASYDIAMTCLSCGDGTVDFGEECDDGGNVNGDGCDANCEWENVECSPAFMIDCGGSDTWHNRDAGHTNNVTSYSCSSWNESGPEYTYVFAPTNSGDVTVALSAMTEDLDIYVLNNTTMTCDPTDCLTFDDTSVTFSVTAGDSYFLVVDGFDGAESEYTIDVSCTNP